MSKKKMLVLMVLGATGMYFIVQQYMLLFYADLVVIFLFYNRRKLTKYFFIAIYFLKLFIQKSFAKTHVAPPDDGLLYFTLSNGRKLSYQVYGLTDGWPVFYFHGTPSSSSEAQLIDNEILINNQVKLIAIDRPGIGMSDIQQNRTFSNWAKDVEEVANKLGLDKFSVLGFSGGGPYVAACAASIPERLFSALIVSGAWQMNVKEGQQHIYESVRLFWKVAAKVPFLLTYILKGMQTDTEEVTDKDVESWKQRAAEVDFNFLNVNNRIGHLKRAIMFGLMNIKGVTWDVLMYVRQWDFDLSKISFPIIILHGLKDRNVPFTLVEKYAAIITNSTLKLYENEGHYSILGNQLGDVICALTSKEAILPAVINSLLKEQEIDIITPDCDRLYNSKPVQKS